MGNLSFISHSSKADMIDEWEKKSINKVDKQKPLRYFEGSDSNIITWQPKGNTLMNDTTLADPSDPEAQNWK